MKKTIATLVITIMVLIQFSVVSVGTSKSQLQNQQSSLSDKIKETQQTLNNIKTEKSSTLTEVENLITQISEYESQIDDLNSQMTTLQSKIDEAQTNLDKTVAEYNDQKGLLNDRLVLMYEGGDTSYLDFVLSSDGLTDFISNYYLVSELTQYDSDLLEQIQDKQKSIETQKTNLENNKKDLDKAKAEKEQKQTEVKNAKAEKDAYVAKLTTDEQNTQEALEEYEADKRAVTSELSKIAAQEASSNSSNSGAISAPSSNGYIFPVPGCSKANISNKSYPSYSGHTGVDVNIGVSGKSVVAVKSGTVVMSTALKNSNGGYRSYGEYVVINHHDGTMTLYAHMLAGSRTVSVGQNVSQGQVIGTVGSTGNSTGTHLHFEVRVGGSPVNPLPYLP